MKKSNGFSLVEVIIATTILFSYISLLTPILSHIGKEQILLRNHLEYIHLLHDELVVLLGEKKELPLIYTNKTNDQEIQFTFTNENGFIKGGVKWNANEKEESPCLYGVIEES